MPTELFRSIQRLREQGRPCPVQIQVWAVVDCVARSWGDDLAANVEATATDGIAVADLAAITELIRSYQLDCTREECMTALLRLCASRTWGGESE